MPGKKAGNAADKTKPHFHGHRERLRDRFREAGAQALSDYELLERVLFRAIPMRDVKPLAKELIKEKRMAPPGLKAFEARDADADARYSFEREAPVFEAARVRRGPMAVSPSP